MKKNRILTKEQKARQTSIKRFVLGLAITGAVFTAPKLWESYRSAQKEQLEKVKAEMRAEKLQAEYEADRAAILKAEAERARQMDCEVEASQKRIKAKTAQQNAELEAMWAKGIFPEGNEDANCGNCPVCKAQGRERE